VRYCCAINGTQSPADIESVVGTVPLLITEILADITEEEEAKTQGFNNLEDFRKERPKTTNHPLDLKETVAAYEFHKTEKQQEPNIKP
jgi:hypothetical protein